MRGLWTLALVIACDGGVMTSEDAGGEDASDAEIPMDTSNTDSDVRPDSGGSDADQSPTHPQTPMGSIRA